MGGGDVEQSARTKTAMEYTQDGVKQGRASTLRENLVKSLHSFRFMLVLPNLLGMNPEMNESSSIMTHAWLVGSFDIIFSSFYHAIYQEKATARGLTGNFLYFFLLISLVVTFMN